MSEILVVGAGPTGLVLANDLQRKGVPYRLVEKAPGPAEHSRAFGIQAGALAALADALGPEVADELVSAGLRVTQVVAHLDDRPPFPVQLELEAQYPFILMLPQNETERILRDALARAGGRVEWATPLESLEPEGDRLRCRVGEKDVRYAWVAGCDGAHSTVRHCLGVRFEGEPYVGDFTMADVDVGWSHAPGVVHTFVNERGAAAVFPFRGARCRVFVIKRNPAPEDAPVDEADFVAAARSIVGEEISLGPWRWLTRFRLHHRLAASWRTGRAFLLGDAAHIHSPVGGQGMNLGMQDALVLGHMLTAAVAKPIDLDLYQRERKPEAVRVVRGTDLVFRQALGRSSFLSRALRRHLAPVLLRSDLVRRRGARQIAQLAMSERVIAFRRRAL